MEAKSEHAMQAGCLSNGSRGRTGWCQLSVASVSACGSALAQACTPHSAEHELWRSQSLPSQEAARQLSVSYYKDCALAEGRMSHFSPPQEAIKFMSLSNIILQFLLREVREKIIFSIDILMPQIDWSSEKLYSSFLHAFTNQMGAPSSSVISFLSLTPLPPYSSSTYTVISLIFEKWILLI